MQSVRESAETSLEGMHHRNSGTWNLSLPFAIDATEAKTYDVKCSENGYMLEKVVVTPYQLVTHLKEPAESRESHIVVFDQNGEMLNWNKGREIATFSRYKLEADTLYIYVFDNMDDWMTMHKSADMNHEVTKEAVLFAEVNL